MTRRSLTKHDTIGQKFTPPQITPELYRKLLSTFMDGSVMVQVVESFLKTHPKDEHCDELFREFSAISHEIKYFFISNFTPPPITQRVWEAFRDYFFSGTEVAQQLVQFSASDMAIESELRLARSVAARAFTGDESREMYDFFHQHPYEND